MTQDSQTTPALKSYIQRTIGFMAAYVAMNMAAIAGLLDNLSQPVTIGLALTISASLAGQIWATLMLMRDSDEYVRSLYARRFIIAAGLAMAIFSGWGFCEVYANAPHISGFMIYPLFWALFGLVCAFVKTTHA